MAIFNKNSSPTLKLFGSFILITIALCFIAIFSDILVDNGVIQFMFWSSCFLSVVIVAPALKSLFNRDSQIRKNIDTQNQSVGVMVFALIIGIPLLTVFAFSKGVPTVLHMASSQQGELRVTVIKKSSDYRQKWCQGGVYLKDYSYFLNNEVCGLKRVHWQSIRPGVQIRLTGEKSMFGFTTKKYTILE